MKYAVIFTICFGVLVALAAACSGGNEGSTAQNEDNADGSGPEDLARKVIDDLASGKAWEGYFSPDDRDTAALYEPDSLRGCSSGSALYSVRESQGGPGDVKVKVVFDPPCGSTGDESESCVFYMETLSGKWYLSWPAYC